MKKFLIYLFFTFAAIVSYAQANNSQNQNWENLGKITLYTQIHRYPIHHGEESWGTDTESGYLYGFFDGDKMIYKVYIPTSNCSYEVHKSNSYTGATVKWDRRGRRIEYLPSLGEMYPYYCAAGYFNPNDARR